MDPVAQRRATAAVAKLKLVALVLVLAGGAYLGGSITSGVNQGGLAGIVAFAIACIVGAVLAVMALVAAILAKSRDESGNRAARSIFDGWIFASHMAGAALAAFLGGYFHDVLGDYHAIFIAAALIGFLAVLLASRISVGGLQGPKDVGAATPAPAV